MARPLLQLPSGNWLDPSTITTIKAFGITGGQAPHIFVGCDNGNPGFDLAYFDTYEDACIARDELAIKANLARCDKPIIEPTTPTDGATP